MDARDIVRKVFPIAVREMWDEPERQGLNYCCEDVVNAAATYAAQWVIYGEDAVRSRTLWPHTPDGYLSTYEELELYDTMMGLAIRYARDHGAEHGIEFVDVWS